MSDQTYQPTLSQLRAFAAVARHRSFRTAATRLNVSQPTLSQALATLEQGLGVSLIERNTRRVMVTDAGGRLLPHAIAVLEAADQFGAVAAAAGDGERLAGPLRMGIIPTIAPYVLPALLPMLARDVPDLELQVVENQTANLLDRLSAGALDVAVLALPAGASGIDEIALFDEPFVLVVPPDHALAGQTGARPDVLADLPLLLLDEGHCLRDQALDLCRMVDAQPSGVGDTRAASLSTVVQCVAGGLGVTLIPEMAVDVETSRGRLGLVRFADPQPGRTIGLVFRSSSARREDYAYLATLLRALRP